ncbi:MAG TPA: stage II sporulation protein M [Candidatus Binatia bacterium]|jgi:stage II sporulation protein M
MAIEGQARSWREQRNYIRELAPYLLASVVLLLAGAVVGVAMAERAPDISSMRREALSEFVSLFRGLPAPLLALAIFLNNAVKTLVVIVAGVFAGILPLVFLLINGYVLGIVFHATVHTEGLWAFVVAVAPHGVLELPAVLLGTSIGLMMGAAAIRKFIRKQNIELSSQLARGMRFFATVIVPLLVVSALIEAFITAPLSGK